MDKNPRLIIGINYQGGFTFSRTMPDIVDYYIVGIDFEQAVQDFMESEAETALDHILIIKDSRVEKAFDCKSI